MKRAIVHIDGDGFFASCEIALNPKLKGLPVVTGQERGIATAMSPEAKALGITRGMPVYQIRKLYPTAVVVNSNYRNYGIFAQRMYDIVRRYTDKVEEYSIDECFALLRQEDFAGQADISLVDVAKRIKVDLQKELGMTFSIGVAPTKVLAKVASKWDKPDGFTIIEPERIPEFLQTLPVGRIWGIGPASSLHLNALGVRTALDFVQRPETWIRENLSRPHLELWYELRGLQCYEVHLDDPDLPAGRQESIQSTRTFTPATTDKALILSELSRNVENACIRARAQGVVAKRVHYFLKTQEFRYQRFEIPLTVALQAPSAVFEEIKATFDAIYDRDKLYRATGVTLAGLVPESLGEIDLFGEVVKKRKWNEVFGTVDKIDRRYGEHTLVLASSLKANSRRGSRASKHLIIPFMGEVV